MTERAVLGLRRELDAAAPDVWPRVRRSVEARRIATRLLAELDRPPASYTRLGRELRLRVLEELAA